MFIRDNQELIPVRPLMAPLKISIDIEKTKDLRMGSVQKYSLSLGGQKVELSKGEYTLYQWKLFVIPEVLKKLDLPQFTIKPVKD